MRKRKGIPKDHKGLLVKGEVRKELKKLGGEKKIKW